jgi:hypothetical protein
MMYISFLHSTVRPAGTFCYSFTFTRIAAILYRLGHVAL